MMFHSAKGNLVNELDNASPMNMILNSAILKTDPSDMDAGPAAYLYLGVMDEGTEVCYVVSLVITINDSAGLCSPLSCIVFALEIQYEGR
jgi:hypothetical protein